MRLVDIVSPERVASNLQAEGRDEALDHLVQLLTKGGGLDDSQRDRVLRSLIQRERVGSTGIGNGIAIPHAKVSGLDRVIGGFARSSEGVEFGCIDGKRAYLFLVLVAPEGQASLHLKALARASRMLRDDKFRGQVMGLQSSGEIFTAIAEKDRGLTA
ncbi:MAG: PTS sugar transporter subunit IIA [Myxococcota bacterium]